LSYSITRNSLIGMATQVLVTGAGGFIGRHLVGRLLRDDCHVRAMVRPGANRPDWGRNVDVVEGDVQDAQTTKLAAVGVDTVFHLAGEGHAISEIDQDEMLYRSINVDGTRNVLE